MWHVSLRHYTPDTTDKYVQIDVYVGGNVFRNLLGEKKGKENNP